MWGGGWWGLLGCLGKSQKNRKKKGHFFPLALFFFHFLFIGSYSYMYILPKHSIHLIFFCNFAYVL